MYDESAAGGDEPLVDCTFDPATTDPVDAVFRAVSKTNHIDLTTARPLASVVDPDALDSLFQPPTGNEDVTVRFRYEGLQIELSSGGEVRILESDAAPRADGGGDAGVGTDDCGSVRD